MEFLIFKNYKIDEVLMDKNKNPKLITELTVEAQKMLTELEALDKEARDITDKFKLVAYRLTLKRYLSMLQILADAEEKIANAIRETDDVEYVVSAYKALLKGIDILNSQLRALYPARLLNMSSDMQAEVNELSSLIESGDVKTVILKKMREILELSKKVKYDMAVYDNQSIEYWKALNTYLELTGKFVDLVNKYKDLVSENETEVVLTVEEILQMYEEIEDLKEKDEQELEEYVSKEKGESDD
jgi:hypothetical protein